MRLTNITEVEAFKNAIEQCKGDVWLESNQGDRYNLKSSLSQYIALSALLTIHGSELELFCQDTTDEHFFFEFFHKHPETL